MTSDYQYPQVWQQAAGAGAAGGAVGGASVQEPLQLPQIVREAGGQAGVSGPLISTVLERVPYYTLLAAQSEQNKLLPLGIPVSAAARMSVPPLLRSSRCMNSIDNELRVRHLRIRCTSILYNSLLIGSRE